MRQTYLATFLDMYEGPCKGIFKVYAFTTSTLTLEVGYESWQSEIETTAKKDTKYKHWLEKTRTLVKNVSTCIQQDDEEDKGEQDGESGHGRASQREWGKWHGGGGR